MNKDSKIFVAGHRGLVGSAILKNLKTKGYTNFVLRTHMELDLTDQQAVHDFFAVEKPEYVFLSAAHVGGIMANSRYRADFIYENLMIQNNVIHASYLNKVKKLLFLGSTCIYPGNAPQPMPEDCLLASPLEYTNEPYAIVFPKEIGMLSGRIWMDVRLKTYPVMLPNPKYWNSLPSMASIPVKWSYGAQANRSVSSFGAKRWQTLPSM